MIIINFQLTQQNVSSVSATKNKKFCYTKATEQRFCWCNKRNLLFYHFTTALTKQKKYFFFLG